MITIDEEKNTITVKNDGLEHTYSLDTQKGFLELSRLWLKSSWDTKQMYTFTWLGTPIIQLPEDVLRIQELIFTLKPDVIIETGVNYGGSLLFYASLCSLLGKGRVIGIELRPRPELQQTLASHPLAHLTTLIEGNSVDPQTVSKVKNLIGENETTLVLLDSKHTKEHVTTELENYAPLVSVGSYIIVMDGIMGHLRGAKRMQPEWELNNPEQAALEFVKRNPHFTNEYPAFLFNGGTLTTPITNCPNGFLKRIS